MVVLAFVLAFKVILGSHQIVVVDIPLAVVVDILPFAINLDNPFVGVVHSLVACPLTFDIQAVADIHPLVARSLPFGVVLDSPSIAGHNLAFHLAWVAVHNLAFHLAWGVHIQDIPSLATTVGY